MPEQRRLADVTIKVDGSPLRTELYDQLMLVRVEESVQQPDLFEVRFADPHFELFDQDKFRPGTKIEIAFQAEGNSVVVTSGECTAVQVDQGPTGRGRHELAITGLDLTHRMARGPKSRGFLNQTISGIAGQVVQSYDLEKKIDSTSEQLAHVLQANETDYAFLRRLAGSIGYDFWITEKTFYFKKKPVGRGQPPKLKWGDNLRTFKVRFTSAENADEVVVTAWDPVEKKTVTGRADTPDYGTDAPAAAEMASAAKNAFGKVTRTAGQFPAASQAEADARAHSLMAKASGGGVILKGDCVGNPLIGAGNEVTLDSVGKRLSGKYRVTSVEHIYGANQPYVTKFTCGAKEPNGLLDILGGGSPADQDHRGWGGLAVGVVTNNKDKDSLGRVKVKFPTLSEDETDWVRVATIGAGASRGIEWLPEVGDEVLVGFESDDKARPIVLGGLWSRKDQPPEPKPIDKDGKVTQRILASRKDHRLVFTDDPKSKIILKLGDAECQLILEQDETLLAGEKKLVINADKIEINGKDSIKLQSKSIEITGTSGITAKGQPIKLN